MTSTQARRLRWAAVLAAALLGIGVALLGRSQRSRGGEARATAPAPPPVRPDVVLITIDTLRADATGFSGNTRASTPTLDRLAKQGRVFDNAHAHNVVTLPSHVNILTGLYPYQHGVRENSGFRLSDRVPTLATLLKTRGYATGAFVGAFPLDGRFGLGRGFDVYDDRYPKEKSVLEFEMPERPATEVVAGRRSGSRSATRRRVSCGSTSTTATLRTVLPPPGPSATPTTLISARWRRSTRRSSPCSLPFSRDGRGRP